MTENLRSTERTASTFSGWLFLFLHLAAPCALALWLVRAWPGAPVGGPAIGVVALLLLMGVFGFFVVDPNMARVLVLFGKYRGTVRADGFHWVNPFMSKHKVSLRAHNLASKMIKVNDLLGNPIEVGAVIVWQVRDTAQAAFDVDDYMHYVDVQIETAVRHMAKSHPYDTSSDQVDPNAITLRGDSDRVAAELQDELQVRLDRAGIRVIEARITNLAYAPEIAVAMLQRQQASAVIAALHVSCRARRC